MDMELARFNMVEQQIRPCDVRNEDVLRLLSQVGREKFVPVQYQQLAFSDLEIPLPGGQAMLTPRVEAMLIQELAVSKIDKVLEIGTGSGYITAILAKLADFVYTIEIDEQNKQLATNNLTYAGVNNVSIINANGIHGLATKAPFDRIFVGGGLLGIPDELKAQLRVGGRLVGLVGNSPLLHAILITRDGENKYTEKKLFETNTDYLINEQTEQFTF
jgi:protein-L-isoaspartate(D-aspartate) O-methyltransferase